MSSPVSALTQQKSVSSHSTSGSQALRKAIEKITAGESFELSEAETEIIAVDAKMPKGSLTKVNLLHAFDTQVTELFAAVHDSAIKDRAAVLFSKGETKEFLDLFDEDVSGERVDALADLRDLLLANLDDIKVLKVGPGKNGKLKDDAGGYVMLVAGRAADGKLAGIGYTVVET